MERGKKKAGMDRRTFIRLGSGAIVAVSGNWFLPKFALGAEEVLIGGLCELSGPASIMGTEQARGMELAVEMYNQKGGVLGRKIKLLMEDTESKKDVGLAKARRLVETVESELPGRHHLLRGLHGRPAVHPGEEGPLRELRVRERRPDPAAVLRPLFFQGPRKFPPDFALHPGAGQEVRQVVLYRRRLQLGKRLRRVFQEIHRTGEEELP